MCVCVSTLSSADDMEICHALNLSDSPMEEASGTGDTGLIWLSFFSASLLMR